MSRAFRIHSRRTHRLDIQALLASMGSKEAFLAAMLGLMLACGPVAAQDEGAVSGLSSTPILTPDGGEPAQDGVQGADEIAPADGATDRDGLPKANADAETPAQGSVPTTGMDLEQSAPGQTPPSLASEASGQPIEGTGDLPQDLSPWGMFMAADYVVKAVMIGLAFASVVTWVIWLSKMLELAAVKGRARRGLRLLEGSDNLDRASRELGRGALKRGPVARLVHSAVRELGRSQDLSAEGVKERVAIALSRVEARAGRTVARGTGLLATIGATAPFVGLFGTVWGIMNSFIGISQSNTTNLAVVAPGIAEALLATGIGLVAAIPAVVIYNVFSRSIAGYRALLSDASAEVLQHLSRDLERGSGIAIPVTQPAE